MTMRKRGSRHCVAVLSTSTEGLALVGWQVVWISRLGPEMFICDEKFLTAWIRSSRNTDKDSSGCRIRRGHFVCLKNLISAFVQTILKGSLPPLYQRATALNADRYPLIKMQAEVFNPCKFWLIIYLYVPWHFYPNLEPFVYHRHSKSGHSSTMG